MRSFTKLMVLRLLMNLDIAPRTLRYVLTALGKSERKRDAGLMANDAQ